VLAPSASASASASAQEVSMSVLDPDTQRVIREAITQLLRGFQEDPLLDLREADPQARLLHLVRSGLTPSTVPVRLVHDIRAVSVKRPAEMRTSRAHMEMKVDDQRSDLIVFRSMDAVTLHIRPAGALDVIAQVHGEELAAVIELKSAPSSSEHLTFREDLHKLFLTTARYPRLLGFFVLLDKSLRLGGHSCSCDPRFDWLDEFMHKESNERVEAWWLDAKGKVMHKNGPTRPISWALGKSSTS
jgi:hypothetical protein